MSNPATFQEIDANADGVLSYEELAASDSSWTQEDFGVADFDSNGVLNVGELEAYGDRIVVTGQPVEPWLGIPGFGFGVGNFYWDAADWLFSDGGDFADSPDPDCGMTDQVKITSF